jgi:hypothetical protein
MKRLITTQQFQQLSLAKQQKMIAKFQQLHETIRPYFNAAQIRKTVASAAMFSGLAVDSVNAQFAEPVTNPFNLMGIVGLQFPTLSDIDGDGDLDLMTTTYNNTTYQANIEFVENIETPDFPAFSTTPQIGPFGIDFSLVEQGALYDFDLADMDNDGDLDLLLGNYGYNVGEFLYYENTGTAQEPAFATPQLNPFGLTNTYQSALPTIIDINIDGDFDILASEYYGIIQYFENVGTPEAPNFVAVVANPFGLTRATRSYITIFDLADIDGNGYADILMANLQDSGLALNYQENIGTASMPEFGPASTENPLNFEPADNFIFLPAMDDLDDDGDIDVLLNVTDSDNYSTSWMYFENLSIVNATNDLANEVEVQIFPNPTGDLLTVKAHFEKTIKKLTIEIYGASGLQVFIENRGNHSEELNFQTNTSAYANGLYLIKTQADGRFSTLKFMKE